jgi:glycosyltransferase involved in cell wall biosynthesis
MEGGLRIGFDLGLVSDRSDGISVWTCQTIELLARRFPQHTLYLLHASSYPLDARAESITGPNIRRVLLNPRHLPARIRRRLGLWDDPAAYVHKLRRLHILHWNSLSEWHFAYLHLLPRLPKIVTLYDATTDLFPEYHTEVNRASWHQHYRRVKETDSWWLTISRSSQRDLVRLRGLDPERSGVVYPSSRFAPGLQPNPGVRAALERFGLRPGQYVLSVGVLEPRKNQAQLIRAFRALKESTLRDSSWKLVLAGGQGWKYEGILAEAEATSDVVVTGKVDDGELAELYRHAALFVYPSFYEGFGLPVLEAMQFGLPVITSKVSSLPEVAGEAAVLIDPADARQLQEALSRLLTQPEERARLSQQSLWRSRQFSEARQAEETMRLFERVLRSPRGPLPRRVSEQPAGEPSESTVEHVT